MQRNRAIFSIISPQFVLNLGCCTLQSVTAKIDTIQQDRNMNSPTDSCFDARTPPPPERFTVPEEEIVCYSTKLPQDSKNIMYDSAGYYQKTVYGTLSESQIETQPPELPPDDSDDEEILPSTGRKRAMDDDQVTKRRKVEPDDDVSDDLLSADEQVEVDVGNDANSDGLLSADEPSDDADDSGVPEEDTRMTRGRLIAWLDLPTGPIEAKAYKHIAEMDDMKDDMINYIFGPKKEKMKRWPDIMENLFGSAPDALRTIVIEATRRALKKEAPKKPVAATTATRENPVWKWRTISAKLSEYPGDIKKNGKVSKPVLKILPMCIAQGIPVHFVETTGDDDTDIITWISVEPPTTKEPKDGSVTLRCFGTEKLTIKFYQGPGVYWDPNPPKTKYVGTKITTTEDLNEYLKKFAN